MSDEDVIRNLEAKMRGKEESRRRLDEVIAAMALTIRVLREERDTADRSPGSRPDSHSAELRDAIYAVLQVERPLHRKVILERVTQAGIYVGGKNPLAALGSYLSMDRRFKSVARGVWTLVEEPGSGNGNDADDSPLRPPPGLAEQNFPIA